MKFQYFTCFLRAPTLLFYVINIIALARRDDVPYIVLLSLLYLESLNKGSPCERRHSLTIFRMFSGSSSPFFAG